MDGYERTTQLGPVLLAAAPLTITALLCFRIQSIEGLIRSIIVLALAAGLHLVLMRLVRDRGNAVQEELWLAWGGSPTIQRLRWRTGGESKTSRLHGRVEAMTGIPLPNAASETQDPDAADEVYEDALLRMRELTRDQDRYRRVYRELLQYGTARNLYGLKPLGLTIAAITFILAVTGSTLVAAGITGWPLWPLISAGTAALVFSAVWTLAITPGYVRKPAERYAHALLATAVEPAEDPAGSRHR